MSSEKVSPGLRGEVVYLYAFDVANEIRLDSAAERLAAQPAPFVTRRDRPAPRDVPIVRPLVVEPPQSAARLHGAPVCLLVRVYEVGVISVTIRANFARES